MTSQRGLWRQRGQETHGIAGASLGRALLSQGRLGYFVLNGGFIVIQKQ